ncbi:hypothetical protein AB0I72_19180 [Nocardiopsis sp. NPDC049922]|uniref:hypothetical protein n=1 Tax=Nocardiopsis sp. NPDC049922 TaxID=3155157 RepID=UPI0033F9EF83
MATPIVLKNCRIEIDGVDLSDGSNQVTVNMTKNEVDTTSFGSGGRRRAHGLSDDSFEIQFMQDYSAASVNATLSPLQRNETEFTVRVRPTSDPVSATNPEYEGTCILLEYTPLTGAPGELSENSVTFPAQGSIAENTV